MYKPQNQYYKYTKPPKVYLLCPTWIFIYEYNYKYVKDCMTQNTHKHTHNALHTLVENLAPKPLKKN